MSGLRYTDFTSLAGGSGSDTFTIGDNVTGSVLGGAGNDTVNYNAGTIGTLSGDGGSDELVGPNAVTTWTLDGAQSGSVGGQAFAAFELITGNGSSDTFNFSAGASYTTVDGGNGTNAFNVTGTTTANLTGGTGSDTFTIDSTLTGTVTRWCGQRHADGNADRCGDADVEHGQRVHGHRGAAERLQRDRYRQR
ncbi:MAG: hypothetical protein U5O39_08445 [Gammaproteobacteria bacterium]|nr:hypothetical protein [Gammaproteobacteria bacterium]